MNQIHFVGTTPNALADLISESVKKELQYFKDNLKDGKSSELMSRKEVAKYLGISLNSAYIYSKKGILTQHQLGTKIFYKRHEVDTALIKLDK